MELVKFIHQMLIQYRQMENNHKRFQYGIRIKKEWSGRKKAVKLTLIHWQFQE